MNIQGNNNSVGGLLMSGNDLNLSEGSTQEKDDLTKLYTRHAARERILERLLKNADEQGVLLLIDLDDFCRINQQYGQTYADSVLKQVGSQIHTNFMVKDIVARMAFDIFLVYCPELSDTGKVEKLIRRLKDRLEKYIQLRDESVIRFSAGAAVFPKDGGDLDTLYAHADSALWTAKRHGKNRLYFYDGEQMDADYRGQTYRKVSEQDKLMITGDQSVTRINRELFDFCFDVLCREKNLQQALYLVFEEVCRYFGFDRCILREYDTLALIMRVTNKWVREDDGNDASVIETFGIADLSAESKAPDYYLIQNGHSRYKDYTEEFSKLSRIPFSCIVFPLWEGDVMRFAITYEIWEKRSFTEAEIFTLRSITKMLSSFILRFQAKTELENEYRIGRMAMEAQKIDYFVSNLHTHEIYYLSPSMRETYKDLPKDIKCYEVMFRRDTPCENCPMEACGPDMEENTVEYYDIDEDNSYTITATRIHDTGFEDDFMICKSDVTSYLQRVKGIDRLTGVMSYEKFRMEALRLLKRKKKGFVLVFLGIQDFVRINDEYGYVTGDEVLKALAQMIQQDLSEGDLFCRVKGDDFIIIMNSCPAETISRRVHYYTDELTMHFRRSYAGITINCFGGIYAISPEETDINRSIDKAMKARNMAKSNFYETSGIYVYTREFETRENEKEAMNRIMKDALENGGFCVYFQSKVDITTGKISGAEALVRLKDKDGKLVPPGKFVPLAEETGMIVEIDQFVYEETFRLIHKWLQEGKKVPVISVNLSRLHLMDDQLPEHMEALCDVYDLRPEQIELEITESVFFQDADRLIDMIKRLKAVGFVISMDDFGAGYSTLNFMKSLPVDIIKIDGGFFMKNKMDDKNKAVISAIMQLSNNLHFKTVSEGVETDEQVEFIKEQGGKYVQGYYFYKPLPPEEFEGLLEEKRKSGACL